MYLHRGCSPSTKYTKYFTKTLPHVAFVYVELLVNFIVRKAKHVC